MVAETVEELASYSRKSGVPHLRSAVRLDSARNLETATGEAFVPLLYAISSGLIHGEWHLLAT
jgi:hypothetical protein